MDEARRQNGRRRVVRKRGRNANVVKQRVRTVVARLRFFGRSASRRDFFRNFFDAAHGGDVRGTRLRDLRLRVAFRRIARASRLRFNVDDKSFCNKVLRRRRLGRAQRVGSTAIVLFGALSAAVVLTALVAFGATFLFATGPDAATLATALFCSGVSFAISKISDGVCGVLRGALRQELAEATVLFFGFCSASSISRSFFSADASSRRSLKTLS